MSPPHERVGQDMDANGQRRAFVAWMRTGRMPVTPSPDAIELKYNPWHDPEDGRFTFAHGGRFFSAGGGAGGFGIGRPPTAIPIQPRHRVVGIAPRTPAGADRPEPASLRQVRPPDGTWTGGGFTGGGGGSFGGGGAAGTAPWPDAKPASRHPATSRSGAVSSPSALRRAGPTTASVPRPPAPLALEDQRHAILRNGYTFEVDGRGRTRRVRGVLTMTETPVRSRTAQRQAGGAERRPTDDGGHYVAARFNGPAEAFNHFAQDSAVYRGRYRAIEGDWAQKKRAGKTVTVRIAPRFDGLSKRPREIDVIWHVDGRRESAKVPNHGR